MRKALVILYLIACMVAGAAADSLAHMNYTNFAVLVDLLEKLLLLSGPFIFAFKPRQWIPYTLCLLVFYMVGFDYIYNWIHELPWYYHGTVKAWDIFLSKIPTHGLIWIRSVLLVFGISVAIRNLT